MINVKDELPPYELEVIVFEVREDRDGLGLIEIIYRDEDEVITQRLPTLTIEQAESFTKLILKVCNYLKKKEVGDL